MSAQRATIEVLPELDHEGIAQLLTLLRDRIAGAPLAHLTGRQQFMGVEFIATNDALIQCEETALLGTTALAQLRAIVREQGHAKVIDVCTGSGSLALALAWHEPCARMWAADLSEEAIALARRNLVHLDLADRVEFRSGNLLAPFDTPEFHGSVDLLICNQPCLSSGKVEDMPQEIIDHEPRHAFDTGSLGIRILLQLISEAPRFLRPGGWLAFGIGLGQGPGIRKRIEQSGDYVDVNEAVDENGQIRALITRRPMTNERSPVAYNKSDGREYVAVVANVMAEGERMRSLWRAGLHANNSYDAKFDWYYKNNPDGAPDVLFLRCGGESDAIGVASVGHRRMRFNNATLLTGVLVDFVVRPEHRTLFPALLLQRAMRSRALQTHQLVWGLPNPKATAVFGRAGYQRVGHMVRYVRVLRSATYLARHLPPWISRMVGPMIDRMRLGAHLLRGIGTRGYITQWQDRPDARFNDLWERSAAPDQLMGLRDEKYLTWRFVEYPFRTCSFFTLVSAVDHRLIGYAACESQHQTLHVRDFLLDPNAPGAAVHLWRELARAAFRMACASVSVEFLGCELVQRQLSDAGLIARAQSPLYADIMDQSLPLLHDRLWYLTCVDVDG